MRALEQVFVVNPVIWDYKKLYIAGTDEFAASVYMELCTRRVYVHGFIDSQSGGISFFHKPVYADREVDLEAENAILLSKEASVGYDSCNLCSDIFVFNSKLCGKQALIYGNSDLCEEVASQLCSQEIEVVGFINPDKFEADIRAFGKIKRSGKTEENLDDIVIIEAGSECIDSKKMIEIRNFGIQVFFINALPIDTREIWVDRKRKAKITPGAIAQMGEYFECEQIKEIILYGNDFSLAKSYAEVYKCLDFPPVSFMADMEDVSEDGINIEAIEEIIYRDDYLVLFYEEDVKNLIDKLLCLGVEKRRYGKACPWVSPNFNTRNPLLDVHMGYTYEMNSEYPGIYIYGENNSDDYKIAILGGSTTDSVIDARICSWAEIMYNQYCHTGVTIFNGGVSGYYSGQELVKLKRDMLKLNPNMVIVYDGYNDLMQGVMQKKFMYLEDMVNFAGRYMSEADGRILQKKKAWAGVPSGRNPVDDWLENIECMYAIAKSRNIDFYSFMQPMLFTKKNLDQHSKTILQTMLFHGNNSEFMKLAKQFRRIAQEIDSSYSYIHDLTYCFDNEDVYMDIVHVYEKGNEIIAENIWNVIKESIKHES